MRASLFFSDVSTDRLVTRRLDLLCTLDRERRRLVQESQESSSLQERRDPHCKKNLVSVFRFFEHFMEF